MAIPSTHSGFLHRIPRKVSISPTQAPLVAFEHLVHHAIQKSTILFLGGLFDGPGTVAYVPKIAATLPANWRMVEPTLSSAYRQWGISTLNDDVAEIADLVQYFRNQGGGKVVLMGHSTGCQMCMHYLLSPLAESEVERPRVEGVVMQASVSDRESLLTIMSQAEYDEICATAQAYVDEGKADEVLPQRYVKSVFGGSTPITARRMLSIASPPPDHAGEDDYFSSDLADDRLQTTFGQLGKRAARIAFAFGEKDEYVLLDKAGRAALVAKWEQHIRSGGGLVDDMSGLLEGGSHTLKEGGKPVDELSDKLRGFLSRL